MRTSCRGREKFVDLSLALYGLELRTRVYVFFVLTRSPKPKSPRFLARLPLIRQLILTVALKSSFSTKIVSLAVSMSGDNKSGQLIASCSKVIG